MTADTQIKHKKSTSTNTCTKKRKQEQKKSQKKEKPHSFTKTALTAECMHAFVLVQMTS